MSKVSGSCLGIVVVVQRNGKKTCALETVVWLDNDCDSYALLTVTNTGTSHPHNRGCCGEHDRGVVHSQNTTVYQRNISRYLEMFDDVLPCFTMILRCGIKLSTCMTACSGTLPKSASHETWKHWPDGTLYVNQTRTSGWELVRR